MLLPSFNIVIYEGEQPLHPVYFFILSLCTVYRPFLALHSVKGFVSFTQII